MERVQQAQTNEDRTVTLYQNKQNLMRKTATILGHKHEDTDRTPT